MIPISALPDLLFELTPTFEEYHAADDSPLHKIVMDSYGNFVGNMILVHDHEKLPLIFASIEYLIVHGDEKMKDQVICHFLESLWVYIRDHSQRPKEFVSPREIYRWMGPRTREGMQFLRKIMPDAMYELSS